MKRFLPLLKNYVWLGAMTALIQGLALVCITTLAIDGLPYLYNGVLYIFAATLLLGVILAWRRWASDLNIVLLSFACVINLAYFALIPTIVDRSISVFVMNELAAGPKAKDELEKAFVDQFVYAGGAVPKRIFEQSLSGNIIQLNDGRYELTPSGHRTVGLFRVLGRVYNTDQVSIKSK
jgi:hypothetical protein